MPDSPFLVTAEVAVLLRCSIRTVHELTRRNAIPHRKMARTRRCLFLESEVREWLNGEMLEVTRLEDGGRIVRPTVYSSSTPAAGKFGHCVRK
jgi:excisionase family DNA binding protein